ncbi:MAG: hypothetical protein OQK75_04080 [Gammaproteobacteria bacterium]|nr:hypothetical protein [Gammaproteobacteria bacterium]MCW8986828.1 hypothetical protein [Gammaproteobacteria bacterium]MCW9030554.1 hypothetical protein [Gammaproteobacteria bacterium]
MNEENNSMELWRWKMIRKVAEYMNQPNDINMSELKAMIEGYRNYHNIKELISANASQIKQEAS